MQACLRMAEVQLIFCKIITFALSVGLKPMKKYEKRG